MLLSKNITSGFIGTYTKNESKGIYRFNFDLDNGKLEKITLAHKVENPTYLTIDTDRHLLYSTCKVDDKAGVASFKYWQGKDTINLINHSLLESKQPCHVSISSDKQILISSNYHENKMIVYNTLDGIILNPNMIAEHECSSIDPLRQEKPHIHCSIFTKDEKYILSIDLGMDKMIVYTLEDNKLIQEKDLSYDFPKGTGPRHITYSKTNPFYYVLSELTSEIFVFKYNPDSELKFENIQILSTLPSDYLGEKSGAAIRIHKNNKFLYTSDRGNNTLSLFYINEKNGTLEYINSISCQGNSPRDFQIDPSGKFLLCANENSSTISIFSINSSTGILTFVGNEEVPNPSCIEFIS